MTLWRLVATPYVAEAPQQTRDSTGALVPIVTLDDETGNFYVGGRNCSTTWVPSGSSGLVPVTPQPTADPRVFTLPQKPALLLLWADGLYQTLGTDKDFLLSDVQITFNYTPEPGAQIQAVVGY